MIHDRHRERNNEFLSEGFYRNRKHGMLNGRLGRDLKEEVIIILGMN